MVSAHSKCNAFHEYDHMGRECKNKEAFELPLASNANNKFKEKKDMFLFFIEL
jgi:hypothetical protein